MQLTPINETQQIGVSTRGGAYPCGWVSIQGELIRRGGDYDARLYYDLGGGFKENQFFEIPTSSKGVINELLCFPEGVQRLQFSPMGTAGEFELGPLIFAKVGALARRWRMMHRVISMIFLHSRRKRSVIRLTFLRMLVDLQGAYKTAGKLRAHAAAPQYQSWVRQFDELTADDRAQINKQISRFANRPYFHVLIVSDSADSGDVHKTLHSLNEQLYRHFTCVLLGATGDFESDSKSSHVGQEAMRVARPHLTAWLAEFNAAVADGEAGEWVMLVHAGDIFAPHALYRFAYEASAKPEAAVLYSDDDALDENGQRCRPRFKPDWSPTHLRSTNFVGNAVVLRGKEVAKAGGLKLDCCRYGSYDLLLRVVDVVGDGDAGTVAHIPAVLLHRGHVLLASGGKGFVRDGVTQVEEGLVHENSNDSQWCLEKVRDHLGRNGVAGDISEVVPGCRHIRYRLPDTPPFVSIIVPTRDALGLIRQCVGSLLEKTTYPRFEILVVDNQTVAPDALTYLEQIARHKSVRLLRYDLPFNYSAMNNMAVCEARGEVVCLLNNDTEVISTDWLEEMVGHLLQAKVGVVGAKLYFPNGQVQHGGDLVGVGGVANHAHAFLPRADPGYCNRAVVAQDMSAVTAACLVTWTSIFRRLGGLNERDLKVAFNDVDYCLRVREAGYRVVWTPHAELYHHESVSRGKDKSPEKARRAKGEVEYMRRRWSHVLQQDPFYNQNLSYERPDFSLSNAPLVEKPWLC